MYSEEYSTVRILPIAWQTHGEVYFISYWIGNTMCARIEWFREGLEPSFFFWKGREW